MIQAKRCDVVSPDFDSQSKLRKRQIVERIQAGEQQNAIAKDLGVTRQYVSLIWKNFRERGSLSDRKRGKAPAVPISSSELEQMRSVVESKRPSDFGLKLDPRVGDRWTFDLVKAWFRKTFDRYATRRHLLEGLDDLRKKLADAPGTNPEFSEDFYAYIKSDVAKEIALREQEWREREEQRAAEKRRRRRRTDEAAGDGPSSLSAADLQELERKNAEVIAKMAAENMRTPQRPPAPGQRFGKHRKQQGGGGAFGKKR